jgi:hypothetical protein
MTLLLRFSLILLMKLKDRDTAAYQRACNKALFKAYNFKARARSETYNVSHILVDNLLYSLSLYRIKAV